MLDGRSLGRELGRVVRDCLALVVHLGLADRDRARRAWFCSARRNRTPDRERSSHGAGRAEHEDVESSHQTRLPIARHPRTVEIATPSRAAILSSGS
jgi:hypothetical protein